MTRRLPPPLVALSPGGLAEEGEDGVRRFLRALGSAADAGLSGFLLREPAMGDRSFLDLARAAREALGPSGWLGLHDRVHLAEEARADAVHLGFRSLPLAEARSILDDRFALGLSGHAGDRPEAWSGADYLLFGPVRDTPSKRGILEPTGFEGLALAVERSAAPVWAIGGLRPEDVRACLAAGCRGLAVLSGILPAEDPARAAREYLATIPR